jgi:type IV pilus assembly protein PilW
MNAMQQSRRSVRGMTLVELMISIVLGLLVTGAAISMFISFSRTYAASETLSRVQENARIGFELMSQDLREAGGVPCAKAGTNNLLRNVLSNANAFWWTTWGQGSLGDGLRGYENGALSGSLTGTDALEVIAGASAATAHVTDHDTTNGIFSVIPATHGFASNDILVVCDNERSTIFQATAVSGATITHPATVSNDYGDNSVLVRLQAERWYVAANGRGGNSLFRVVMRGSSLGTPEEVLEGVSNMQLTYLNSGANNYVTSTTANWPGVRAVRVELTLDGRERVDGQTVNRTVAHTITLRSRNA